MSEVIKMYPEPHRAEKLIDAAGQGGIEIYVQWCKTGTYLLFHLHNGTAPTPLAIAAMVEMSERFGSNFVFRSAIENYSIQIGSAVHNVDEKPWLFTPAPLDAATT